VPYVNRIIKNPHGVINKTFVSMMEQLGYDIEVTYVKREYLFKKEDLYGKTRWNMV